MKNMKYIMLRMEKTFLFIIKAIMMICLALIYFSLFSHQIIQLQTLNRTSMVTVVTFFVSVFSFIRIYGGFPVGQKHTKDIRNSAILGTIMGDLITFIIMYVMGVSGSQYSEFSSDFVGPVNNIPPAFHVFIGHYIKTKVLPGLLILLLVLLLQILTIWIFSYLSNTIYFHINDPKKVLIIYQDEDRLPELVSKISKYPRRWIIVGLAHYQDKNIRLRIRQSQTVFLFDVPKTERSPLIEYCYKHSRDIYISPDVSDILLNHSSRFLVDDTTMLAETSFGMSFEQLVVKRLGDILFSSLLILLTSPFMLVSAIAIKVYDRGPILYRQKRLTKGGREFEVLKFRSMIVNAEQATGAMIAKENDERITPVGKLLRRFRLDELPQLFNIFIGDMSVVGPRPERLEIAQEYEKNLPGFRYRLKVKAGLTGLAQIMSKYNTSPKDKLTLDLSYIQQYSLWLDIKLILQTLIVFLKSDSTQGSQSIDESAIEFVKHELQQGSKDEKTDHHC